MKIIVLFAAVVAVAILLRITPHYHCWGPQGGLFIAASNMTGECEFRGVLLELRRF